ncbi:hypothetical protein [Chitinophaga nivalis]|uniref:Uncharacterized protein n=1 Tax=Chitinophaga nivalis TaxID=2991709 RepID=A0ABT3IJ12_9BACT|nr:hypothetical protein [Chitinophaga nivalis]MCW3466366.1 hypothetical protein [Chitinophaga nivalis]MCW3483943.1 hypothetical protein [Chitinophaga nivalis]
MKRQTSILATRCEPRLASPLLVRSFTLKAEKCLPDSYEVELPGGELILPFAGSWNIQLKHLL